MCRVAHDEHGGAIRVFAEEGGGGGVGGRLGERGDGLFGRDGGRSVVGTVVETI